LDPQALLLLIRDKLQDGRLPHDSITRVWSNPSSGETCNACETRITKDQLVTVVTVAGGRTAIPFHVACFRLWDAARRADEGGGIPGD